MTESIHGHRVLEILEGSESPLSVRQLREVVVNRYGEDARFHTCSAQAMNLDELLVFLSQRGKVSAVEGLIEAAPDRTCHDE
jgi:probable metal-binding protein